MKKVDAVLRDSINVVSNYIHKDKQNRITYCNSIIHRHRDRLEALLLLAGLLTASEMSDLYTSAGGPLKLSKSSSKK